MKPLHERQRRVAPYVLPGVVAACLMPLMSMADHVPEILVVGQGVYRDRDLDIDVGAASAALSDSNALMARVPGGANNSNGPLSGQLQYRGLFGPRVGTRVNGAALQAAGPNWMDSPLHYAPAGLVESFRFSRGLSSISQGPGLGGSADVVLKGSRFTTGERELHGDLRMGGHSVDSGYGLSAVASAANDRHRAHIRLARDDGDDTEAGDGRIAGTAYERDYYGVGYGWRGDDQEVGIEYTHVDTGESGNPVLPLDLALFDTDIVQGHYDFRVGEVDFSIRAFHMDVVHQMDNYRQRQTPDFSALPLPPFVGTDRRFVDVESETTGVGLEATYVVAHGQVRFGVDARFDEHEAVVGDPDVPPFFIENFNAAESDTYTAYGEWLAALNSAWQLELGFRYARVEQDAGAVDAQPAQFADAIVGLCVPGRMPVPPPCAVRALRNRFNAADRSRNEDLFDWLARLRWQLLDTLSAELGFARKSRAPSHIERYSWIPLEVNAGLGDGNNYVGRLDLDPEVAHKAELGFDWRTAKSYLAPRGFYHRIDDYIQGTALTMNPFNMPVIGVSGNANGDATPLRFSNVEAELYGVDVVAGYDLPGPWRADLAFSYVRGKRVDINDDLFRIAPPTLRMTLAWEWLRGFVQFETVMRDRQTHVSDALTFDPANRNNNDRATPGSIVLNLRGQAELGGGFELNFGVENLLDHHYRDHLAGFNRVLGSDVAVGQRLPGAGLNGYLGLAYRW